MSTATCRSCRAPILWALTAKGRRIPLDTQPVPDGNILLSPGPGGIGITQVIAPGTLTSDEFAYTSHFATCPNAKQHRR